jgi:hypothetical protein
MSSRSVIATTAFALGAFMAVAGPTLAADRDHPVVVELFQSQGCSSCPPANANVLALADRPDVLALSFQVTYWDQLGWKDTFASPKFTARQWDYARTLKHSQVWTPQVVVNGRIDTVGTRRGEIEQVIAKADRGLGGPTVSAAAGAITVSGVGKAAPAEVWLVRYDPSVVQVPIRRGENGGKTLPHRNVVHELVRLGDWSGTQQTYALPKSANANLKTAILVQQGRGGAIIAAARI